MASGDGDTIDMDSSSASQAKLAEPSNGNYILSTVRHLIFPSVEKKINDWRMEVPLAHVSRVKEKA